MSFLNAVHDRFVLLFPIAFGWGIHIFFTFHNTYIYVAGLATIIGIILYTTSTQFLGRLLAIICFIVCFGIGSAAFKTHLISYTKATPSLPWKGTVTATIESIEHNQGQARIMLKQLSGKGLTLNKARVNFKYKQNIPTPEALQTFKPGQHIKTFVHLFPIPPQETPLNYNFEFFAFYQGIEAIGFGSLKSIKVIQDSNIYFFERIRNFIAQSIRQLESSQRNEIAVALITGQKFGIKQTNRDNFANSGLAHLLAISGLHLSLITGLMFVVFRKGFSLIPYCALRWPLKKIAAVLALLCSLFYLKISGGSLPTLRAFIMATFIIIGIITNREAISLRSVAIAALIVLAFSPEALYSPSFQMSFAAVTCLIAAYEQYIKLHEYAFTNTIWKKALRYLLNAMASSLIATLATLPFIIFTFHRFSWHSIEANLIAIPLMTFFIMPLAILVVVLIPFGLHYIPLQGMWLGIDGLIYLASTINTWPGSFVPMHPPHTLFLPLVLLGAFCLILVQHKIKWLGLGCIILAFTLPPKKVFLLLSNTKHNLGVVTADNQLLTTTGRNSFVNKDWQGITTAHSISKVQKSQSSWIKKTTNGWSITPFKELSTLEIKINSTPTTSNAGIVVNGFPTIEQIIVNGKHYTRGGLVLWKDYNNTIHVLENDRESRPWSNAKP